ncbi:MAG: RlmE family RNA methyltransferase [Alphaproteobacteria bacterium GM7ARS4]|nr:RlmE family RNA methyltransferase [Alphaproteobacteria bacterium GM7ARS4]
MTQRGVRKRSISSRRWLQRHHRDIYVLKAQRDAMPSRAAYKLEDIHMRHRLFTKGCVILDLGAVPGGWSVVALKHGASHVMAVDTRPMAPPMASIDGVMTMVLDIRERQSMHAIRHRVSTWDVKEGRHPFDGVMADLAPHATGHKATDHMRQILLARHALRLALFLVREGGFFLCKLYQGVDEGVFFTRLNRHFHAIKRLKPKASRSDSLEFYVLAYKKARRQAR